MPRFDVTIAGELNLDLILYGLPEQLAPERELLADRMILTLGSSSDSNRASAKIRWARSRLNACSKVAWMFHKFVASRE
jgi:hypothetical protein